jgi:hypothetical protein
MIDDYKQLTQQVADVRKQIRKTSDEKERQDLKAQLIYIQGQTRARLKAMYSALDKDTQKRVTFKQFAKLTQDKFAAAGFKAGTKFKRSVQDILADRPPQFEMVYVTDEAAQEAAQKFSDALKSRLDSGVDKIREAANKAFEAMAKAKMQVFDDQIKAIEAVEKAEQELYETEKYLADRRKLLQNQQTNAENYRRDRALAIYEGRYDDARMLDLEFQKSSEENSEQLKSLDDERNKTLLQKERDAQKARIEEQKKAMEEQLEIQRKAFEDQLALITEYTPKNLAEMTGMIDSINGLLTTYGAQSFGDAWAMATGTWATATEQAGRDVADEAYWAGVGAAVAAQKGILQENPKHHEYIQKLEKPERERVLAYLSNQAKRGGMAFDDLVSFADIGQFFHVGGMVGNTTKAQDVPAVLQTGEYVVQRKAVQKLGVGFLNGINKYHEGGLVGSTMKTMLSDLALTKVMQLAQVKASAIAAQKAALMGGGGPEAQPIAAPVDTNNLIITSFQRLMAHVFPEAARSILGGSTFREGPMVSFHATGQALDIGNAIVGNEGLDKIFQFLLDRVTKFDIVELIYKDQQYDKGPGLRYYPGTDHFDHIHVAIGRRLEESIAAQPGFFSPLMRGGKIPIDNFPALLHKGEVVLPANIVRNIESANQNSGGDTYICVDTFIGQRQWFESMMKEYNVKTLPAEQRRRGTMNRVVSSRKDNTVRYV